MRLARGHICPDSSSASGFPPGSAAADHAILRVPHPAEASHTLPLRRQAVKPAATARLARTNLEGRRRTAEDDKTFSADEAPLIPQQAPP